MELQLDADLVRGALAGDRAAYGALFDRYATLVRAICYDAARNVDEARDLAQEAFLRGYRRLGRLRRPERFAPWIAGIARHVGLEWRRRLVAAAAAALLVALGAGLLARFALRRPVPTPPVESPVSLAQLEREVEEEGIAAQYLASADLLAQQSELRDYAFSRYRAIARQYPHTAAGRTARERLQAG